jgi:hypothetical protein
MNTIICESCGTENPDNVKFCKQCGSKLAAAIPTYAPVLNEPSPTQEKPAPTWTTPVAAPSNPSIERRYGALRSIAALCRIIAYVFGGLGIIGGLVAFIIGLSDSFFAATAALIGGLISALLVFVFWLIIAESISVILDIEENTRRTAVLLKERGG